MKPHQHLRLKHTPLHLLIQLHPHLLTHLLHNLANQDINLLGVAEQTKDLVVYSKETFKDDISI